MRYIDIVDKIGGLVSFNRSLTGNEHSGKHRVPPWFQAALVMSAAFIVCAGWYFIDRKDSYVTGYPAPRTYLARSATRYVDGDATSEMQQRVGRQIVDVSVRDDNATQFVRRRIDALKLTGEMNFIPARLNEIINKLSNDDKTKLINAIVSIAEEIFDKNTTKEGQDSLIWSKLMETNISQQLKNIAYQVLAAMLVPTITNDNELANTLRNSVAQNIPPVVREIKFGMVIAEKGQIVTQGIADTLKNQGYPDSSIPVKQLAFITLSVLFWSVWLSWLYKKMLHARLTTKEWVYIVILLVIDWSIQRIAAKWIADSLSVLALVSWLFLTMTSQSLAFHISLGGSLIGYLIAFPGMSSSVAIGCVISGVASGASIIVIKEALSRIAIWRNIFKLGLLLTGTSLFIRWGLGQPVSYEILGTYLLFCVLWSSVVVAVTPIWESLFELLSPLRLLEMSSPSQPLLRRLQIEAPGTYHHTLAVATLAETVADRLGMNGLLIRAGAYYHDVGKLKRPSYFVENQSFGDNIHDRLAPKESARIIIQHVKDGLELADEYKLPEGVKRFIREHHGTTFMGYFYNKALSRIKDGSLLDKALFTYPGPAPHSRETALLMLADSIDAALKSLPKPLSGRAELEKLVGDVISSKLIAGQFNDVDFTLSEINVIKLAFVDVLMPMYHSREIKPIAHASALGGAPAAVDNADADKGENKKEDNKQGGGKANDAASQEEGAK
ncbi:phosphohydrolase [Synergistales bacterium]|nr:phosphohydrolase [Synergistales bacterium]